MGNEYDRIIKENIESVILPLADRLLGIHLKVIEEIPDDLQLTVERKPDFTRKVTDDQNKKYILHIEYQSRNESRMVLRMQTYRALLQERHRLPVRQFVIYLGLKPASMKTKIVDFIKGDDNNFQYTLIDIHRYDYSNLLDSKIPEEIILAILGNFKNEPSEQVVAKILARLATISKNKTKLQRYIRQLMVIAKLRNLETETTNQIESMPIEFDIETDGIYLRGKAQGEQQTKRATIIAMLKDGFLSLEKIATYAQVSVKQVREIQQEISTNQ